MAWSTTPRSAIDPRMWVNGESRTSTPTASTCLARSVRISASPRWPALPVTSIFMRKRDSLRAGEKKNEEVGDVQLRLSGHRLPDAGDLGITLEQYPAIHRECPHYAG